MWNEISSPGFSRIWKKYSQARPPSALSPARCSPCRVAVDGESIEGEIDHTPHPIPNKAASHSARQRTTVWAYMPMNPALHYGLGTLYRRLKQHDKARHHIELFRKHQQDEQRLMER